MHPALISHCGVDYSLAHLQQSIGQCQWKALDGTLLNFSVRCRYSTHCYSEKVNNVPVLSMAYVIADKNDQRIFDVDRYNWSVDLPGIINGLLLQPTQPIQLTPEHNGYVFRLKMNHPLPNGEIYYAFIRLKRSPNFTEGADPILLDLYIESAYSRSAAPKRLQKRIMFGRLAEKLVK